MVETEDACCKRMFVEEEREAIRAQKRGPSCWRGIAEAGRSRAWQALKPKQGAKGAGSYLDHNKATSMSNVGTLCSRLQHLAMPSLYPSRGLGDQLVLPCHPSSEATLEEPTGACSNHVLNHTSL